jgi:hypothetical protein
MFGSRRSLRPDDGHVGRAVSTPNPTPAPAPVERTQGTVPRDLPFEGESILGEEDPGAALDGGGV